MANKFEHKFKYQQMVWYNKKGKKPQLAAIESLILGDKYHYQVRLCDSTTIYNCTEEELTLSEVVPTPNE